MKVYYETWTESERGWGCRPDGCSLHISKDEYDRYVDSYWKKMPDEPPDEYSRPDGEGVYIDIPDDHNIAVKLKDSKSIRFWNGELSKQGISVSYGVKVDIK